MCYQIISKTYAEALQNPIVRCLGMAVSLSAGFLQQASAFNVIVSQTQHNQLQPLAHSRLVLPCTTADLSQNNKLGVCQEVRFNLVHPKSALVQCSILRNIVPC